LCAHTTAICTKSRFISDFEKSLNFFVFQKREGFPAGFENQKNIPFLVMKASHERLLIFE
jgi:hypothetical protein